MVQSRLDVVRGVGYHDDLMIKDFRLERDFITIVISVKNYLIAIKAQ